MKLITVTFVALGIAVATIAQAAPTPQVDGTSLKKLVHRDIKVATSCTTQCFGSGALRTCYTNCY